MTNVPSSASATPGRARPLARPCARGGHGDDRAAGPGKWEPVHVATVARVVRYNARAARWPSKTASYVDRGATASPIISTLAPRSRSPW